MRGCERNEVKCVNGSEGTCGRMRRKNAEKCQQEKGEEWIGMRTSVNGSEGKCG